MLTKAPGNYDGLSLLVKGSWKTSRLKHICTIIKQNSDYWFTKTTTASNAHFEVSDVSYTNVFFNFN